MRTILYIVLINFFLVGMVLGQDKLSVPFLTISECKGSCPIKQEIKVEHFENSTLNLEFGVELNCCFGDTFIVYSIGDTLFLESTLKDIIFKRQEPLIIGNDTTFDWRSVCMCDCYFEISIKVKGLNCKPKYICVDNLIYDSIDGFIGIDWYKELVRKDRKNNSIEISSEELINLLGKKLDDYEVSSVFKKVGNDSLTYSHKDIYFKYDFLYLQVDSSSVIEKINIGSGFLGKLPSAIKVGMSLIEVGDRMGEPSKKWDSVSLNNFANDESQVAQKTIVFYYSKSKMELTFDSKEKLLFISFVNKYN